MKRGPTGSLGESEAYATGLTEQTGPARLTDPYGSPSAGGQASNHIITLIRIALNPTRVDSPILGQLAIALTS